MTSLYDLKELDVPMRRMGKYGEVQDARNLRNAIGSGLVHLVEEAASCRWLPKDARLQIPSNDPKQKGEWLGWLSWAVWQESHHPTGQVRRMGASTGVLEALVTAGLFDWNALTQFPDLSWRHHPGFQAIEKACLDRLAKAPKGHRIFREGRERWYSASVYPHKKDDFSLDQMNWLDVAVQANRLDVVERWVQHSGVHGENSYNSPWRQAWENCLAHRSQHPHEPINDRMPRLLENALIEQAKKEPAGWARDNVLSLMGLAHASRSEPRMNHAPTQTAMLDAVARVLAQHPVDLSIGEKDRHRLPSNPETLAMLADQEGRMLHATFDNDTTLVIPKPSRRRL